MVNIILALNILFIGTNICSFGLCCKTQDSDELILFTCKEGNCTLRLPAEPKETYSKTAKGSTRSYRIIDNKCSFMFSAVEMDELKGLTKSKIEKILDNTNRWMDAKYSKTTLNEKVTLGEYPGRESRQESTNVQKTDGMEVTRARVFIVKTKLYIIVITGDKQYVDSDRSSEVLKSLKLSE